MSKQTKASLRHAPFQKMFIDFSEWLRALGYSATMQRTAPKMVEEYLLWLEGHAYFDKTLNKQSFKQFMGYFENRPNRQKDGGLSIGHINKQISVLNLFFRFLLLSGELQQDVHVAQIKEKAHLSRVVLSKEQILSLYGATRNDLLGMRDRAMLSVYYGCGLRRSEGLGLELQDVFYERKLLQVRHAKNGRGRLVPMSDACLSDLKSYIDHARPLFLDQLNPTDLLFITQQGKPLGEQVFGLRLRKLREESGDSSLQDMHFSTHALRHSIATHLMEAGMELDMIGRFLGHRSLDSTQLYTHLMEQASKERSSKEDRGKTGN